MSTEEDTELRDLVAQTLESNGCLSKIRVNYEKFNVICFIKIVYFQAQLRASVFLALDEDEGVCILKNGFIFSTK